MKLIKLTEHVFIYPYDKQTDYPNIGIIKTDNETFLIDAGISKRHVESIKKAMNLENIKTPSKGCVTHFHYDHSYGMFYWKIPFYVCKNTQKELERISKYKYTLESLNQMIKDEIETPFTAYYIYQEYKDNLSNIKIKTDNFIYNTKDDKFTLSIGNDDKVDIELINKNTSPHSKDSTWVYVKEDKVIFVGDSCYGDVYKKLKDYSKEDLKDFFTSLLSIDFDYVVFGHQEVGTKQDVIAYYHEHKSRFN